MKELNKESDDKIEFLQQENLLFRKNTIDKVNEKDLEVEFLKKKCFKLEKEIQYQESIISYLENLLKSNKSKINFKFFFIFIYY